MDNRRPTKVNTESIVIAPMAKKGGESRSTC